MHPKIARAKELTENAIGAAIEVHQILGPGLLESVYEKCLIRELELRKIPVSTQEQISINYKGLVLTETLKFDLLLDDVLLLELKAVESILPIHKAQLLSYMKLLDVPLGLLINFHSTKVVNGISRLILPGANRD